jgi:chemotaxis protein MotA
MFSIIGIVVVLGAVIGGFLLEKGNLHVLFQPAEFMIIFGAAIGSLLIASPPRVLSAIIQNLPKVFAGKGLDKVDYMELLILLYKIFQKMRKEGLIAIEAEVNEPEKSPLFTSSPIVLKNKKAVQFICDTIKMTLTSNTPAHELDTIMESEIEVLFKEGLIPSQSVNRVADSLPGLGIVAAVLGVVLTMGKIDQPPAVLGHSIGAALVGTFLGVLACYGFVGPIAAKLEHIAHDEEAYLNVIRLAYVAYIDGSAPQMAVELGRRAIPFALRPGFEELQKSLKEATPKGEK